MRPGEKADSMGTDKTADGCGALDDPLVIDGFLVDEKMLPCPDDLPDDLRDMAKIIGIKQVVRLGLRFAGCRVCFPSFKHFRARLKHERIRADYDAGVSVKQLAQKYDLCERHIWTILGS